MDIDEERILVINIISLNKLIVGGAAILAIAARNHKVVIAGNKKDIPLVRVRLREVEDS